MDLRMLILSKNHIEELCVFNDANIRPYKLPGSFFSCHRQLTRLLMINCEFNPPLAFSGYSNLERLALAGSSISTHSGSLISNLPSLLCLCLRSCTGIKYLKSPPTKLEYLVLHRNTEVPWQYFHAKTKISTLLLSLSKEVQNAKQLNLTTFLANLPELAALYLDGFSLKLLAAGISPKLYLSDKLTEIALCLVQFNDLDQVSCTLRLLRSCPNLQSLKIICETVMKDGIKHYLDNMEPTAKSLDISLNHLRTVTLTCFNGSKAELLFVKLILSCSCMLQQMIIRTRKDMVDEEELRISRQLMKFHRASVLSEIIFEKFNNSDYSITVKEFRK